MVASIQEHDQIHLHFHHAVVVLKELLDLLDHFAEVVYLLVDPVIDINALEEVTEDDAISVEDLFSRDGELGLASIDQLILEPLTLFHFNQTISKYAHVLMQPQSQERDGLLGELPVSRDNALVDSGNITQVEKVMLLGGGGLQRACEHRLVDLELCLNKGSKAILNSL